MPLPVLTQGRLGTATAMEYPSRVYVDHGLTGTNRDRPGLREAMAACRDGDTLVVTRLDRLARSLPDARSILEGLTARQVRLSAKQEAHLAVLVATGQYSTLEVAELFSVGRSTVYRAIQRAGARAGASVGKGPMPTVRDTSTR